MRLTTVLLAAVISGCATSPPAPAPDSKVAAGFSRPQLGSLIVVVAPSEAAGHAKGHNQLLAQLTHQASEAGYRVATLTRSNFDRLWAQLSSQAGGVFDPATGTPRPQVYAQVLSSLAQTVCEEARCELLVVPGIVTRTAALDGSQAEWDGVRQPVRVKDGGALLSVRTSGTTSALSVDLLAISKSGELAFRSYAGVALVFATNLQEAKAERVQDPFSDEKDMTNAVRIALEPLTGSRKQ